MHPTALTFAGLLFSSASVSLWACPRISGIDPAIDMKVALDYYPTVKGFQLINGADCAIEHFAIARQQDAKFRKEKSTATYRYARFLAEIADLQSKAARRVRETGGGTGKNYYERETEVRTILVGWCLGDKSVCDIYKQLGALANAYELAGRGTDFHDWMVSNSPESLAVGAALKVWLRGVYSCPAWDFHPPQAGNLLTWREACTPGCITVAREAGEALEKHGPRISSLKEQISALVDSVKACEREGT